MAGVVKNLGELQDALSRLPPEKTRVVKQLMRQGKIAEGVELLEREMADAGNQQSA